MYVTFDATQKAEQKASKMGELFIAACLTYNHHDEIDLSTLEPLIALPGSPGNVLTVKEVENKEIHQAYIGSSANPGFRDFAVPAMIIEGKQIAEHVSLEEQGGESHQPYLLQNPGRQRGHFVSLH